MKKSMEATDEVRWLVELFGLTMTPHFEGPEAECPICRGAIGQHALTVDPTGVEPLACHVCGAVLAA
jgi:hypothetical protein